ncbi:hypothetical protein FF38_03967 [Lucilia cuprina]|uniref:Uncharacterized protein n=1 Tax=Lucilia cuprina TaxID=7375 RepID=A0A0L0CFT0_LUCCU|nr:hypothetical protein FF38_03967 [Lucilia cuprina]
MTNLFTDSSSAVNPLHYLRGSIHNDYCFFLPSCLVHFWLETGKLSPFHNHRNARALFDSNPHTKTPSEFNLQNSLKNTNVMSERIRSPASVFPNSPRGNVTLTKEPILMLLQSRGNGNVPLVCFDHKLVTTFDLIWGRRRERHNLILRVASYP